MISAQLLWHSPIIRSRWQRHHACTNTNLQIKEWNCIVELGAAVVDPGMDVDGKFKVQVDDDAEIELNCEY